MDSRGHRLEGRHLTCEVIAFKVDPAEIFGARRKKGMDRSAGGIGTLCAGETCMGGGNIGNEPVAAAHEIAGLYGTDAVVPHAFQA